MSNKIGYHDGKNFRYVKDKEKCYEIIKDNPEEIEALCYLIDWAENNYFCNKCGNIVTDIVKNSDLSYCPYCGNKIK